MSEAPTGKPNWRKNGANTGKHEAQAGVTARRPEEGSCKEWTFGGLGKIRPVEAMRKEIFASLFSLPKCLNSQMDSAIMLSVSICMDNGRYYNPRPNHYTSPSLVRS